MQKLKVVASSFHIENILDKRPHQTSGGEQQRAATARALIHEPLLILADEPTGNLDSKAAKELMGILSSLNAEQKVTITMVTHDPLVASFCQRILFIRDGRIYTEVRRGTNRQAFYQQILDVLSLMGGSSHDLTSLSNQQH